MKKSEEVDLYISTFPEKTQEVLEDVRSLIWQDVPDTSELINYNIPAFTLIDGGKREEQIMIAGYKNHIGFYDSSNTICFTCFRQEVS